MYAYVTGSNKRKRTGHQWRSILDQTVQAPAPIPAFHCDPSQVFVHGGPTALGPEQRALRFNLNPAERTAFVNAKPRIHLFPQQEDGVDFMQYNETPERVLFGASGGIFRMPPRAGKTKTFLMHVYRAVQRRVRLGQPRFGSPTLLVVPKSVVDTMIFENQELFAEGHELLITVIMSDSALAGTDIHTLISSNDLIITSYSTLITFHQRWVRSFGICDDIGPRLMFRTRWLRIICDEAHRLANRENVVFDAVSALDAYHRWFVTATPITNSPDDILSALRFLHVDPVQVTRENVPRLLGHLLFNRDYDDLIKIDPNFAKLKPPGREAIQVALDFGTASERAFYKHIEAQSFLNLSKSARADAIKYGPQVNRGLLSAEVRPENMALRLRQACLSPWLLPEDFIMPKGMRYATEAMDGHMWYKWMHGALMGGAPDPVLVRSGWPDANTLPPMSTKERYVLDYIRTQVEPAREKIVIFSEWTGALGRIHKLLSWRATLRQGHDNIKPEDGVVEINGNVKAADRRAALQRMRTDPSKYIMLVTLQSGGLGEDFTFANHGILIDPWWTPATEHQALMRLYGVKQTRPIHIKVLCIVSSIEDYVQARADAKRAYESIIRNVDTRPIGVMEAEPDADFLDPAEALVADPEELPTYLDPQWFLSYMQQTQQHPVVDDMEIDDG
jgi:SNF2 family DNA or RNA helicase